MLKGSCLNCGKLFTIRQRTLRKFCSRKCYVSFYKSQHIKKSCPICGRIFEVLPSREERIKTCSVKCGRELARLKNLGKKRTAEQRKRISEAMERRRPKTVDINDREAIAYLKGIMEGDGYYDFHNKNPRIGLDTVSKDFALDFKQVLEKLGLKPSWYETVRENNSKHSRFRKYSFVSHVFTVRATVSPEFVRYLNNFEPTSKYEKVQFIKGFYQSEGCYVEHQVFRKGVSGRVKNGIKRCVQIHNMDMLKLKKVQRLLDEFGISSKIYHPPSRNCPFLMFQGLKKTSTFLELLGSGAYGGRGSAA